MKIALTGMLIFALGSGSAFAYTLDREVAHMGGESIVTRINNLEFEGQLVNVTFHRGTVFDAVGNGWDDFVGDELRAQDFVNTIVEIFNNERVLGSSVMFVGSAGTFQEDYSNMFEVLSAVNLNSSYTGNVGQHGWNFPEPGYWFLQKDVGLATSVNYFYADMSVVPVPAAVWLFASGLGLLGWIERKQVC